MLTDLATLSTLDVPAPEGASPADMRAWTEAARDDALRGLEAMVGVAAALGDPKNSLPIRLVDFCFK